MGCGVFSELSVRQVRHVWLLLQKASHSTSGSVSHCSASLRVLSLTSAMERILQGLLQHKGCGFLRQN